MNNYIDIYCERLEPGLWAEPLNAVTNAAFFIAAFAAYHLAKKQNALTWQTLSLILLIGIIGVGSTLFHTFATFWAMMSDTLPILFYQIVFLVLYSRYIIGLRCGLSAVLLGLFFLTMAAAMNLPREWLNGTLEYAPAFLFVFGLGVWHAFNAQKERFGLLFAAGVFVVSMSLRSIDMQLCEHWPIGTHFFWHVLNGCVLYLTTRAYIKNQSNHGS